MTKIKLMVLDMAGTTVRDKNEVEDCFLKAAKESNLKTTPQRVNDLQGIPKLIVINTLWEEYLGKDHPDLAIDYNNLAELYSTIGKYKKAEELFVIYCAICHGTAGNGKGKLVTQEKI